MIKKILLSIPPFFLLDFFGEPAIKQGKHHNADDKYYCDVYVGGEPVAECNAQCGCQKDRYHGSALRHSQF